MTRCLLFIIFCLTYLISFGQVHPNRDRQIVLRHDKIGKTYVFDHSTKEDYNKIELTYLGKIGTNDGRIFKVLISRWYWGFSPRATSRIVVFNDNNRYLGNYNVGMTYNLPYKIEANALVFGKLKKGNCDRKIVTRISFRNGLPKEFFLECKNKMGDIYSFGDE